MDTKDIDRKIAVIFATDVVGYSKHMEKDENQTLKSFEESLKTAGISPLNPIGEIFNPEKHEAISVVEDDKRKPNTVVEVVQIGFTIQERMLRPAKVVVPKKKGK